MLPDLRNIIYKKEIKQDNPEHLPFWIVLTLETNCFLMYIFQDDIPTRILGAYPLKDKDFAIEESVTVSLMCFSEILALDYVAVYPNVNIAAVAQG